MNVGTRYVILALLILVTGCATGGQSAKMLSPAEFKELIQDDSVFVLDVHVPEQEHIEGTDSFLPYNALDEFSEYLPEDKNTPIALYCRSGGMTPVAAKTLFEMGYTEVYDLKGGRNAYVRELGE